MFLAYGKYSVNFSYFIIVVYCIVMQVTEEKNAYF